MAPLSGFYGADQASIHDDAFGGLAADAAALLLSLLHDAGHDAGTVVDLGCGSGILARALSEAGYRVLGVDLSPDMLSLARAHAPLASFVCSSLLDFALPDAVAISAVGEALNYTADDRAGLESLGSLFTRVRQALPVGGIFLFDVSTPGRAGPDRVVDRYHDHGSWVLHMRATESPDGRTLERAITMFVATRSGEYRRTDERHVLRLYELDEVVRLLDRAGFDAETRPTYPHHGGEPVAFPGWSVVLARARPNA